MKEALDLTRLVILYFIRKEQGVNAINAYNNVLSNLRAGHDSTLFRLVNSIARTYEVETASILSELQTLNLEELEINE